MNPHTDVDNFDDPVDQPDNADLVNPAAATLNTPTSGALNRTRFLKNRVLTAPALSWTQRTAFTNNIKRAVFNAKDQAWIGVGDGGNDFGEMSFDYGRTWANLALGYALTYVDVAAATSGTMAIITSTRNVIKGARTAYGTYTWTNNATMLVAAPAGGGVDFDATAGKFIAVYRTGAVGHADYAADPAVAWTGGTVPAAWATYVGTNAPEVTAIPGRAIAAYVDASVPRLNIMYSTDGGATWTNVQKTLVMSAASAAANSTLSKPAYDAASGMWFVAVSSTSGRVTEVYSSTNGGATWNLAVNLSSNDWVAQDLASLGGILAMTNDDARFAYSLDKGVTWKLAIRHAGSACRRYLRSGGGGFLSTNSVDKVSFVSTRMGDFGTVI